MITVYNVNQKETHYGDCNKIFERLNRDNISGDLVKKRQPKGQYCFERKCYLNKIQDSLVDVVDYVNNKESLPFLMIMILSFIQIKIKSILTDNVFILFM